MKFRSTASLVLLGVASLATPTSALAHIKVKSPSERPGRATNGDPQKAPPCGVANEKRSNVVTTFKPGEEISIDFTETVIHPGYFRVALDLDGDDSFTPPTMADWRLFKDYDDGSKQLSDLPQPVTAPVLKGDMYVLLDYVGVHKERTNNGNWTFKAKLPDQTCTNCTIQIIQMMVDKASYSLSGGSTFYYHCADIKIEGANPGTGGSGGSGMGGSGGTSGSGGAGGNASMGGSGGRMAGGGEGGAENAGGSAGSSDGDMPGQGGEAHDHGDQGGSGGASDDDERKSKSGGCSVAGARDNDLAPWLLLSLLALIRRRRPRA